MIVLKRAILDKWLDVSGHNYKWLAHKTDYSKGYISWIVNESQTVGVSGEVVERFCYATTMDWNWLFYSNGLPNLGRYLYGQYDIDGKSMNKLSYNNLRREEYWNDKNKLINA